MTAEPKPRGRAALVRCDVDGHLGVQVRARRVALGVTQNELARRAGLTQRYVSFLEKGTRGGFAVSAWHLYRLARELGTTMEALMGVERLS